MGERGNTVVTTARSISSGGITTLKAATLGTIKNVLITIPGGMTNNTYILIGAGTVSANLFTLMRAAAIDEEITFDLAELGIIPNQVITAIGDDVGAENIMVSTIS